MPAAEPAPIMVIAGEVSGDLHGATLCRALRALAPARPLVGMGGDRMAAAGLERLADVTAAAAIGGTEAFGPIPTLLSAWRRLKAALTGPARPAALVLIDFPEFNLRLARVARRAGIPVVYFIPPQVWAWRPWRVRAIRERVSLVLAVFPFEAALYRQAGLRVEFVGHPVLDALDGAPGRDAARRRLGLGAGELVIGVLPGSRRQEIESTLPVLQQAAARIAAARPGARFVLAAADVVASGASPGRDVGGLIEKGAGASGASGASPGRDVGGLIEKGAGSVPPIQVVRGDTYAVMRAADVLLVTSGTATLEAALLGTPMVVCYRFSRLTEAWVRLLVRVPWISLPSIALGRAVVPELYQRTFTAERVADTALGLLASPAALDAQRAAFRELAGLLGEPGVGTRAARAILSLLGAPASSPLAAAGAPGGGRPA
ncbi:MAG TPA: lipid-A-disaccharide synthase [Candidatus Binatia bacterium]|nr:lipid-A-disaccharide synthase [Candidatus Binatia bacterium]